VPIPVVKTIPLSFQRSPAERLSLSWRWRRAYRAETAICGSAINRRLPSVFGSVSSRLPCFAPGRLIRSSECENLISDLVPGVIRYQFSPTEWDQEVSIVDPSEEPSREGDDILGDSDGPCVNGSELVGEVGKQRRLVDAIIVVEGS
jgi:hypothetical protein